MVKAKSVRNYAVFVTAPNAKATLSEEIKKKFKKILLNEIANHS